MEMEKKLIEAQLNQQEGFSLKKLQEKLARLDAYPKTLEDFRIKTLGGATGLLSCFLVHDHPPSLIPSFGCSYLYQCLIDLSLVSS